MSDDDDDGGGGACVISGFINGRLRPEPMTFPDTGVWSDASETSLSSSGKQSQILPGRFHHAWRRVSVNG